MTTVPEVETTMRAAVVAELGTPLTVTELSMPSPGPGEALVKLDRVPPASATPTCMPPTATGPSSRSRHSCPGTRVTEPSWP